MLPESIHGLWDLVVSPFLHVYVSSEVENHPKMVSPQAHSFQRRGQIAYAAADLTRIDRREPQLQSIARHRFPRIAAERSDLDVARGRGPGLGLAVDPFAQPTGGLQPGLDNRDLQQPVQLSLLTFFT